MKSPRYAAFTDFVEFQNAEYDLAVALARAGSYGAALDVDRARSCARGPGAPYWGPAHRRAVDIALETRDHAGVLARLEAVKTHAIRSRRRPRASARTCAAAPPTTPASSPTPRASSSRSRRRAGCTRRRSTCAA